jgi:hypothetical protein
LDEVKREEGNDVTTRRLRRVFYVTGISALLMCPAVASAQSATTGGIAGTAKDATGAVLPGVTVEAASPALIEKVRSVVTDAQGNYKIVDLRPGTYSVTFTLPGFGTFKREGIDLTAGFTAAINAEMKVGALEETVTVTGASPVVDVQNARSQQVMKTETLNQLPSGAKNLMAFASMTLGANPDTAGKGNDVGGDKGEGAVGIILHGGRGDDSRLNWDGMSANSLNGSAGGKYRTYYFNTVAVQEVVLDTGGANAETETGGANVNMVPREGSNQIKLFSLVNFTNQNFSTKSVPDDLKARGVGDQSSLKRIYDGGLGIGGPIRQDSLWFYATYRSWGADSYGANNYFNVSTNPYVYVPDLSRPAYTTSFYADSSVRLTWQATSKQKISHEAHLQYGCNCWAQISAGALTAPEATNDAAYGPQVLNQTTWSYPATNRLLFQAGASFLRQQVDFGAFSSALNANRFLGTHSPTWPGPQNFAITEQTTGYTWGAQLGGLMNYGPDQDLDNFNQRVAVSYVTGSHAVKMGLQMTQGHSDFSGMTNGVNQVDYTFRNGAPISLTQFAGPFQSKTRLHSQGLFAQDQWTMKKLTLNYGIRFDHFNGYTPAQDIPAGPFRPAYHVDEVDNLPDFKDITPRFGASYDLFGNGKTAVKGSWGRYLMAKGDSFSAAGFVPAVAIVTSASRTWTDTNHNFVPDCVLTNLAANGECGVLSNPLFGQPFSAQTLAADVRSGWGNREFNYQWNLQVQQELRPGVGLAVGYFHTQWGNMSVTQNTRVTPADYTPYCITAPSDSRLGAVSGQQICGYYDPTPAGLAKGSAFQITQASNFGTPKDAFNGVDVGLNARWGKGALLTGGVSVGREVQDFCFANGHPELTPQNFPVAFSSPVRYPRNDQYCHVESSWWNGIGSQAKLQVVYPLPYHVSVSAAYKNLPGIPISTSYVLTNAQLAPILGRNLSAGAAATATQMIVPFQGTVAATLFDQRLNETDLRFSKALHIGRGRLQGMLDLYNIFNSRVPQAIATTYGATFMTPSSLLGGRLWKFGAQVDW